MSSGAQTVHTFAHVPIDAQQRACNGLCSVFRYGTPKENASVLDQLVDIAELQVRQKIESANEAIADFFGNLDSLEDADEYPTDALAERFARLVFAILNGSVLPVKEIHVCVDSQSCARTLYAHAHSVQRICRLLSKAASASGQEVSFYTHIIENSEFAPQALQHAHVPQCDIHKMSLFHHMLVGWLSGAQPGAKETADCVKCLIAHAQWLCREKSALAAKLFHLCENLPKELFHGCSLFTQKCTDSEAIDGLLGQNEHFRDTSMIWSYRLRALNRITVEYTLNASQVSAILNAQLIERTKSCTGSQFDVPRAILRCFAPETLASGIQQAPKLVQTIMRCGLAVNCALLSFIIEMPQNAKNADALSFLISTASQEISLLATDKRLDRLQMLLDILSETHKSADFLTPSHPLPQPLKDMATSGPYESRFLACKVAARLSDHKVLFAQLFRKEIPLAVKEELKAAHRRLLTFLSDTADTDDQLTQAAAAKGLKECQTKIAQRPDGIVLMHFALRRSAGDAHIAPLLLTRSVFMKVHQSVEVVYQAIGVASWVLQQGALKEADITQCADFLLFCAVHTDSSVRRNAITVLGKVLKACQSTMLETFWNRHLGLFCNIPAEAFSMLSAQKTGLIEKRKKMWTADVEKVHTINASAVDLTCGVSQSEEAYLSAVRKESIASLQVAFLQRFAERTDRDAADSLWLFTEGLCVWQHVLHSCKKRNAQPISKSLLESMQKLSSTEKQSLCDGLLQTFVFAPAQGVASPFQEGAAHALAFAASHFGEIASQTVLSDLQKRISASISAIQSSVDQTDVVESAILNDEYLLAAYLKAENQNYLADKFAYAKRFIDENTLTAQEKAAVESTADRLGHNEGFFFKKVQHMTVSKMRLEKTTFATIFNVLRVIRAFAQTSAVSSSAFARLIKTLLEMLETIECRFPLLVVRIEDIVALSMQQGKNSFVSTTIARVLIQSLTGPMIPSHGESGGLSEKWIHAAFRGIQRAKPSDLLQVICPSLVHDFFGALKVPLEKMRAAVGAADLCSENGMSSEKKESPAFKWLCKSRHVKERIFSHSAQAIVVAILKDSFCQEDGAVSIPVFDALLHIAQTEPVFANDIADVLRAGAQRMDESAMTLRLITALFGEDVQIAAAALFCLRESKALNTVLAQKSQLHESFAIGVSVCQYNADGDVSTRAKQIIHEKGISQHSFSLESFVQILFRVDERTFERLRVVFAQMFQDNAECHSDGIAALLSGLSGETVTIDRSVRVLELLHVTAEAHISKAIEGLTQAMAVDNDDLQGAIIRCGSKCIRNVQQADISQMHTAIQSQIDAIAATKALSPAATFLVIILCALLEKSASPAAFAQCMENAQRIAKKKVPAHLKAALCAAVRDFAATLASNSSDNLQGTVDELTAFIFDLNIPTKQITEGACIELLVAVVVGCGIPAVHGCGLTALLQAQSTAAKAPIRTRAVLLVDHLHDAFGARFEPYVFLLTKPLLDAFFDADGEASRIAKAALQRVIARLTPVGTQQIIPAMLAGSATDSFRAKRNLMRLIVSLTLENAAQVLAVLHVVIPFVVEYLADTHELVAAAAVETITRIGAIIPCVEIRDHIRRIIAALQNPGSETADALDALLSARFHHSVDIASLSLVLPIILRGVHERSIHTKMKAAQILCSITGILTDFSTLVGESLGIVATLFDTISEPVEEYQSSVARAIASLLEHHEEPVQLRHMEFYKAVLTAAPTGALERAGAAKVAGALFGVLPESHLRAFLGGVEAQFAAAGKEAQIGHLQLFHELAKSDLWENADSTAKIVDLLLSSIAGSADGEVQSKAMDLARAVIRTNCEASRAKMLESFRLNILRAPFATRKRSLLLLADLFFQIAGVRITQGESPEAGEGSDGEDADSPENDAAVSEKLGEVVAKQDQTTDELYANLTAVVAEDTVREILAAVYVMRLERDKEVKSIATVLWKTFVSNSHSFVRSIADLICSYVFRLYGSADEDDEALATQAARVVLARFPGDAIDALFDKLVEKAGDASADSFALCGLTQLLPRISDGHFDALQEKLQQIIHAGLRVQSARFRERFVPFAERIIAMRERATLESIVAQQIECWEEARIEGFRLLFSLRPKAVAHIVVQTVESDGSGLSLKHVPVLHELFADEVIQPHVERFAQRILERLVRSEEAFDSEETECIALFESLCASFDGDLTGVFTGISADLRSIDSFTGKKLRLALLCALGEIVSSEEENELLNDIFAALISEFDAENADYVRLVQQKLTGLLGYIQGNAAEEHPLRQFVGCVSGCLRATRQGCLLRDGAIFHPLNDVYGLQSLLPFYLDAIRGGTDAERNEALQGLTYVFGIVDEAVVSSVWPLVIGDVIYLIYDEVAVNTEVVEFLVEALPRVSPEVAAVYSTAISTVLFDSFLVHPDQRTRAKALQCVYVCREKGMDGYMGIFATQMALMAFQRLQRPHPSILESVCGGLLILLKNGQFDVDVDRTRDLFEFIKQYIAVDESLTGSLFKLYGYLAVFHGESADANEEFVEKPMSAQTIAFFEGILIGSVQHESDASQIEGCLKMIRQVLAQNGSPSGIPGVLPKHAVRLACRCLALRPDSAVHQELWSLIVKLLADNPNLRCMSWKVRQVLKTDVCRQQLDKAIIQALQKFITKNCEPSEVAECFPKCVAYEYDSEVEDACE